MVFAKVIAEIWEHGDITKKRSDSSRNTSRQSISRVGQTDSENIFVNVKIKAQTFL